MVARPFYKPRRALGRTRPGLVTRSLAAAAVTGVIVVTVSPGFALAEPPADQPTPAATTTAKPADEATNPVDPPTSPAPEPTDTTSPTPEPTDTATPEVPDPALDVQTASSTVVPGTAVAISGTVTGISDGTMIRFELRAPEGTTLGYSTVEVTGGTFAANINLDADAPVAPGDQLTIRNNQTADEAAVTVAPRTARLSSDDLAFGDDAQLSGAGFPIRPTSVYLDGAKVDTVNPALPDGRFSVPVTGIPAGTHTVTVGGSEPITLTVNPNLHASAAKVWAGDTVSVTSQGWAPGAIIDFAVRSQSAAPITSTRLADDDGTVTFDLAADDLGPGSWIVSADGTNRIASFKKMSPALLNVNVQPGRPYTIRALQLHPGEQVSVTILLEGFPVGDPVQTAADDNGTVTIEGTAPQAEGSYTIELTPEQCGGLVATMTVKVPDPDPTDPPPTTPPPVDPTLPPVTPTPTPTPTKDPVKDSDLDDDDPSQTVVDTIIVDTDPTDETPTPVPTVDPTSPAPTEEPTTTSPTPTATDSPAQTDGDNVAIATTLVAGGVLATGGFGALIWHFLRRPRGGSRIAGE